MATDDYAWTLWTYIELGELERLERLSADADAIMQAQRTATAMHEPRKLAREMQAWRQRAGALASVDDALQQAKDIVERIAHGLREQRA